MSDIQAPDKKVRLSLIGIDSNAFAILGAVAKAMKRQGFTEDEIEAYKRQAKSGDHDHLVAVSAAYCDDPEA